MAVGDINPLVPTADATTNVYQKEVVGNKADAANETGSQASLIGLARAIIARLVTFGAAALATSAQAVAIIARLADPPGVDDVADVTPSDRIGMKADTVAGTSLVSLVRQALAALGIIDAFHDVPVADTADNVVMSDVIGTKLDTEAGDSLYANLLVPVGDAAADVTTSDVVGAKADTVAGTSLVALVRQALAALVVTDAVVDANRAGTAFNLYPDLAAGATVTAAGAWAYGAYAQVAAAGPAAAYKVIGFSVDTPSAVGIYQLEIATGAGAAEVEYAAVKFEIATDVGMLPFVYIHGGGVIAGATRLAARLASAAGAAETMNVTLHTQEIA